ncbi:MAG: AsnC family transcriptional regulator [candidate division Zixibacteria bacterium CG_4_9_14_3_um_filter_46_8]|nr:MAG: AsnC family transcriptional regulator [candidate division Zixibacteria bacterium CG_4_9_14_3_um_filter_46_8]
MQTSYVLMEVAPGKVREAVKMLNDNPRIKKATAVAGAYDIVVEVDAPNHNTLSKIITEDIHEIAGLVKTTTLIAFELE